MKKSLAIFLIAFSGFAAAQDGADKGPGDEAVVRGHLVYGKFCAKCHGQDANGQGKDAWKYAPAPTNFRIALAARGYMVNIVKKGGKPLGRSEDMPDWGSDLSDAQIQDVVDYLMSVRINK